MQSPNVPGQVPEIMTRRQCAGYLKICLSNLDKSDCPRLKLSTHAVRYRKSDVDKWLERFEQKRGLEAGGGAE